MSDCYCDTYNKVVLNQFYSASQVVAKATNDAVG